MKKALSIILALVIVISIFAGCAPNNNPGEGSTDIPGASSDVQSEVSSDVQTDGMRTIESIDGSMIEVPVVVERIASIHGPSYERIFMLGAEDKIVVQAGFTPDNYPWCDLLFKTPRVPTKIQAMADLNIEEVLSFKPDVVFNFEHPQSTETMQAAGLSVVQNTSFPEFDTIKKEISVYAEAIGTDEAREISSRYSAYFDSVVKRVTDVTNTIPESDRPKVYFASATIERSFDKSSPLIEMVELAGGQCVTSDLDSANEISPEQLATWNPDYIILDHVMTQNQTEPGDPWLQRLEEINGNEQYAQINAVKNQDVYCAPSGAFFWDVGVQRILLLMYTAKIIHPDEFADLDMAVEIQNFYKEFYRYDLTLDQATAILNRQNPS